MSNDIVEVTGEPDKHFATVDVSTPVADVPDTNLAPLYLENGAIVGVGQAYGMTATGRVVVKVTETTLTFTDPVKLQFHGTTPSSTYENGRQHPQPTVQAMVAVSTVLQLVAGFLLAVSVVSLVLWVSGYPFILNPVISMMSIVATPFVYGMGKAAQATSQ